jgi:hypothetical protein
MVDPVDPYPDLRSVGSLRCTQMIPVERAKSQNGSAVRGYPRLPRWPVRKADIRTVRHHIIDVAGLPTTHGGI